MRGYRDRIYPIIVGMASFRETDAMSDVSAAALRALELRFDGPIPRPYLDTERAQSRRRRGTIALLEDQAAQRLDAAERCQREAELIAAELLDRDFAHWQRDQAEYRHRDARNRRAGHVRAAATAFSQAADLRRFADLEPHPLVAVSRLLADRAQGRDPTQGSK